MPPEFSVLLNVGRPRRRGRREPPQLPDGFGRGERSFGVTFTVPRRRWLRLELSEVLKVARFLRVRGGRELPTAAAISHRKAIFLPNTMLFVSGTIGKMLLFDHF